MDSIDVVRGVVVIDIVVAGRVEADSIPVVRGVYIFYSGVIRVIKVNSSFIIASSPNGEAFDGNIICGHIEDVVIRFGSLNNAVGRPILRPNR